MPGPIINYSDLVRDDGGFKKLETDLKNLERFVEAEGKKLRSAIKITDSNDSEALKRLTKEVDRLKKANDLLNKTKKAANTARKKSIDLTQKERIAIAQEREATRKLNAEARAVAKIKNTQAGSIENLRAKLSLVTIAWTKLSSAELANTKRGQRLSASKKALTEQLIREETATGDARRQVGKYGIALRSAASATRNFLGALGVTAGLVGLVRLLSGSIGVFAKFEESLSGLQAILGPDALPADMERLTATAKELGATTAFTASEVVELQTAFARLGFNTDEIEDLTESTLNAAAAMKSGLGETAALTGSVLKAFGLDASEAARVNDVLARSTSASALDFQKLNAAMSTIAPVANAFGFSVEDTTTLLGSLSDAGFDASSAATSTRNILLNLADSNGALAKSLGGPVKTLPELVAGLNKLKSEGVDLGTALQLTDKRSVAAFQTFLNGTESTLALRKSLEEAGGTAQRMADTQLDNLSGSVTILNSAWEGFILSLEDGSGAFGATLRNIVDTTTEILSLLSGTEKARDELEGAEVTIRNVAEAFIFLGKLLFVATSAWVSYRVALAATNAITRITGLTTKGLTVAQNLNTIATNVATAATKAFNTAMKLSPIGLIIALLATAAAAYVAFGDSVDLATKQQNAFNDATEKSFEANKKVIDQRKKGNQEIFAELEREAAIRKSAGEDEAKIDAEIIQRKKDLLEARKRQSQENIKNAVDEAKAVVEASRTQIAVLKEEENAFGSIRDGGKRTSGEINNDIEKNIEERGRLLGVQRGIVNSEKAAIEDFNKTINELDTQLTININNNTSKITSAMQKRLKDLDTLRRRLEDIQDSFIRDDVEREIQQINRSFDREIAAITGNSQVEKDLRVALERDKQRAIQKVISEFEEDLDKESEAKKQRTRDEALQQIKLDEQIAKTRVVRQKSNFKTQEDFEKFKAEQFRNIQINALAAELRLIEESEDIKDQLRSESLREQLADLNSQLESATTTTPPTDPWKEYAEDIKAILDQIGDKFIEINQKGVDAAEERLSKQEVAEDRQRQRAQAGLENTLKFEAEETAKREAELLKAQKKLERAEKIKSLYSSYQGFASDGKGNALGRTLRDFAILEGIAASFGEGGAVDDVLIDRGILRGQSHQGNKGGIPIMVEGEEGIFSKKEMHNMGKDNFYALKNLAKRGPITKNFFKEQKVDFVQSVPVPTNNKALIHEVKNLRSEVANKPVQNVDIVGIANGIMEFQESIETGNKTVRNKMRIYKKRL